MIFEPDHDLLFVLNNSDLHRMIVISKFSNQETQQETYSFKTTFFSNNNI